MHHILAARNSAKQREAARSSAKQREAARNSAKQLEAAQAPGRSFLRLDSDSLSKLK
jgi:hypothetical protein